MLAKTYLEHLARFAASTVLVVLLNLLKLHSKSDLLLSSQQPTLRAGRLEISKEAQAMAFMAGANAIFTGEKLLTTANPEGDFDAALLGELGMKPRAPYKDDENISKHAEAA